MSSLKSNKKFEFPVNTMVGSTYSNFKKIVTGHAVDKEFKSRYYLTKGITSILGALGNYEDWRYNSKINNFEIKEAPVFIIGFWRSGTTVLHNLLSQNPDFGYVTLYQAIFPHLCLMNQWWVKNVAKILLPETRPYDKVKLDFLYPQEEEIAMGNIQELSFYNFFYYPNSFDFFLKNGLLFEGSTPSQIQIWKDSYVRLVKTALINTNGNRFISKNPPNTVRIKLLLELFPDAKFIYMHRNTYQTLFSFQRFMHAVHDGIKLQNYDRKTHTVSLIRIYKVMLDQYEAQKGLIPPGQLIDIKFEAFEKDMVGHIENIYQTLDLPDFKKVLPLMEKYESGINDYSRKDHPLDADFIKLIDKEIGNLVEL